MAFHGSNLFNLFQRYIITITFVLTFKNKPDLS